MQTKNLLKSGILSLVLVTTFILGWEGYWRSRGYVATYNDDKVLWTVRQILKKNPAYNKQGFAFLQSINAFRYYYNSRKQTN